MRFVILAVCTTLCAAIHAQQAFTLNYQSPPATKASWSGSAYYDVHLKHMNGVAFNRIGELTIRGKDSGIEANGFVGLANAKGTPGTIGIAAIWHHKMFDQIQIIFGLGGSLTGGKWGGGPLFGAEIRF